MEHAKPQSFSIPPLVSGGVMLSYQCTNRCKHCLYRCSPKQPDDWMTPETAEKIFEALLGEPRLGAVHLAGGEPTLRMDLLVDLIRLAVEMGIRLSYVETNASWCETPEAALSGMERMKEAGLEAILISVSPFHNEFVPFRNTRHGAEAAARVFGEGRTILYLPHMYEILDRMPGDGRHRLDEFLSLAGLANRPDALPALYGVIPNGRAVTALRNAYTARPASAYRTRRCAGDLSSTLHFHIDPYGHLFTGLCAGLAPATVDNLHPEITAQTHPVFAMLAAEGPWGLMKMAEERHGYEEQDRGYVSPCDLCLDVRGALHETGEYAELRPSAFYTTE
jgi:hypothetical protein